MASCGIADMIARGWLWIDQHRAATYRPHGDRRFYQKGPRCRKNLGGGQEINLYHFAGLIAASLL
jgi:hypothetical protein